MADIFFGYFPVGPSTGKYAPWNFSLNDRCCHFGSLSSTICLYISTPCAHIVTSVNAQTTAQGTLPTLNILAEGAYKIMFKVALFVKKLRPTLNISSYANINHLILLWLLLTSQSIADLYFISPSHEENPKFSKTVVLNKLFKNFLFQFAFCLHSSNMMMTEVWILLRDEVIRFTRVSCRYIFETILQPFSYHEGRGQIINDKMYRSRLSSIVFFLGDSQNYDRYGPIAYRFLYVTQASQFVFDVYMPHIGFHL